MRGRRVEDFDASWSVQMNDTHPALAVAELMRLLVDTHWLDWNQAWAITQRACSYTNHTLLAEALETWPVELFGRMLPRHLEIVYEINRRFLDNVRARAPEDHDFVRRVSLIGEEGVRHVRMAHLACAGSHAINGVASMHTDLLKQTVLRDFYRLTPERFFNITNGVTPRRWMVLGNPGLAGLITTRIGDRWISNLEGELPRLAPFADDRGFQEEWRTIKAHNKRMLAAVIKERTGVAADPQSMFDVQVKRLHEYKRQHLNVLHLVTMYNRIRRDSGRNATPRTAIFSGKAAPGYRMAKLIIKLIHAVGAVINRDPVVSPMLKVVFLPDFNVKLAQHIYPAADLSEQISTAGKEASGTGNMKFSLNGALTIGTLDGANVEIRDAVGPENFFLFGLTADDVHRMKAGGYRPHTLYEANPELREALDMIDGGYFSDGDRDLFRPLVESLLARDDYMLLADYESYIDCQERVGEAYRDPTGWTRLSILNCASVGRFSSDRSVREYCRDIWNVTPLASPAR
jgi:starch phosphorylase